MAEVKLSGWKAAAALLVVAVVISVRAASMGDMKDNEALIAKVRAQLMSEYMPRETEKVRDMFSEGQELAAMERTGVLATTELQIKELKVSYPVYIFSTGQREGVVKVRFTLSDKEGVIKDGVNYYRFENNPLGNTWYIKRPTGGFDYYAKFLI